MCVLEEAIKLHGALLWCSTVVTHTFLTYIARVETGIFAALGSKLAPCEVPTDINRPATTLCSTFNIIPSHPELAQQLL